MVLKTGFVALLVPLVLTGCAVPPTPTATPDREPTITPAPTGTLVSTATPTNMPTPVPPLTWDMLKNAGYPDEWPSEGVAQLEDGEYREKYMPDSATEMVINLAPYRLFGDLNGDSIEDAAVILIATPGGSGTFYYLSAVLNQGGQPRPLESRLLGDRVVLRDLGIDDGHISVELDVAGPDDPMCCPTDRKRQTFAVEDDELVLVDEEDLPDPETSARLDVPQEQVEFEPGATSAIVEGNISFNGINSYMVPAMAGQTMTMTVTSPHEDLLLSIFGGGHTLQNADRFPNLIQAEYEAGHVIANHTFDDRSLSSIGRESFFHEVQAIQEIVGDKASHCLRPPYGATDSYTRARVAELGYEIVMWDIDTEDWRQAGPQAIANEVLEKAYPGAVVLMHDGGGDRSQTVDAPKTILRQLSDQGYRFEAICKE